MSKTLWSTALIVLGVCLCASPLTGQVNNVIAHVEGELVTIYGDDAANSIVVSQNAFGTVTVRGAEGTTVNGLPLVRFANVTLNAMEILMEGGNDRVRLANLRVANDLFVNLGAGKDRLLSSTSPCTVGANLDIEGDSGTDIVRLTNWTVRGSLTIDGHQGILNARLRGVHVGKGMAIISDAANDFIRVERSTSLDSTFIGTGSGNDRVVVDLLSGFDCHVETDEGADQVTLTDVTTFEDIGVNTGTQNDTVYLTGISSGKNITVTLDDGSDFFTGTGVFARYDAVFEGGSGLDVLVDQGVFGGEKLDIKEFEIFP